MRKTTIYLPDDLKRAIARHATQRGTSEAEVIRESLRAALLPGRPRPTSGVFAGRESIAADVDLLLQGFGER